MTIEQIREAVEAAERDILERLEALRTLTGLCPMEVEVGVYNMSTIGSPRNIARIGQVAIEMEPI